MQAEMSTAPLNRLHAVGRLVLAIGLALALAALLWPHGASAQGAAPEMVAVVVVMASLTNSALLLVMAEEAGYCRAAGLNVRQQECLGGQRCIIELFEGRAILVTGSDFVVALKAFKRDDCAVVTSLKTAASSSGSMTSGTAPSPAGPTASKSNCNAATPAMPSWSSMFPASTTPAARTAGTR